MKNIKIIVLTFALILLQFYSVAPLTVKAEPWFEDLNGDGMPDNFTQKQEQAYNDIRNGTIKISTARELANPDYWIKMGVSKLLGLNDAKLSALVKDYKDYENGYYNKYGNLPLTSCLALNSGNIVQCTREYEIWKNSFNKADSGNRNYYNTNNYNNYQNNNTTYTSIYNKYNKTINYYDNTQKTWVTNNVTNYDYDITNNTYNYYDYSKTYKISYNYNYTYFTSIGSDGTEGTHKYYFKLPDGSNSLNASEDELNGLKLDYVIENYKKISDTDKLQALYHFNGDPLDSSTNLTEIPSFPTTSYQSYTNNHGSFPVFINRNNQKFNIEGLNLDNQFTIEFKYYNGNNVNGLYNKKGGDVTNIYDRINQNSNYYFGLSINNKPIYSLAYNIYMAFIKGTIPHFNNKTIYEIDNMGKYVKYEFDNDSLIPFYADILNNYKTHYGKVTMHYNNNTVSTGTTDPYSYLLIDNVDYNKINNAKNYYNFGEWQSHAITYDNGTLTYYINGKKIYNTNYIIDNKENDFITFDIKNMNYSYIDEVRIVNKVMYENDYKVSNVEYDSNVFYVLPETDTNNKILVQSLIDVNGYQIGGKRPSLDIPRGYVYVYVDDNGYIRSSQQYNGFNFVEVKSAIYDEILGKWINLIGTNISNDVIVTNPKPIDDEVINNVRDINSLADYLSLWFEKIITAIKSIGVGDTNIINEAGTNIWDFLISLKDSIFNGITDMFGGVFEFVKMLFIPSQDFIYNLEFSKFKTDLGFLTLPFELLSTFINKVFTITDNTITNFVWTDVKINDVILIKSGNYNLRETLESDPFNNIYQTYLIIVDGFILVALVNLIKNKVLHFLEGANHDN